MKIVEKEGKEYVFDIIRRKYVVFTPEEKVRQQLIHWMINQLNYPKASISVEKRITINKRTKRYDIVIYREEQPWMLIECKSEKVKIDQSTFEQIGQYNMLLKVPYLLVSNGLSNYILNVDFVTSKSKYLTEMPEY